MPRNSYGKINRFSTAKDDSRLSAIRRDLSAGMNERTHNTQLEDNEVELFENVDISTTGARIKRPGLTLVKDVGASSIAGLFGFNPVGGTPEFIAQSGTTLYTWDGVSPATFTSRKSDFTASTDTEIIKAFETGEGDVILVKTDSNNWFRMNTGHTFQDLGSTAGTGTDSPPASKVATFYRNRLWVLKNDELFFSDAAPSDYSTAFNTTTNAFRMNVGNAKTVYGTYDLGLLVGGDEQIWALNPSVVPDPTSDKPEKLLDMGIVARKTFVQIGDDYAFLAYDGVRGLKRTIQDKLQLGRSEPLSYKLKDQTADINWDYADNACAIFFDNKYFIALPTGSSTTNNVVWVYFPATNGWSVIPSGWNVNCWATFKVDGEEQLFAGESTADGLVYRAWSGVDDNGTAITYTEIGKNEDLGQPMIKKAGGEINVVAAVSGDYDIDVYASFDDGGFNLLGSVNLSGGLLSFPLTFPVVFPRSSRAYKKFHLDSYAPWYTIQPKFVSSDTTSSEEQIKILEHQITALADEYIAEEEA